MDSVDTLISARWVIPIEPAGRVLDDHSIAIHQGRLVAIAPTALAKQRFSAAERIERPNHVLLPGFVNAHTHSAMSLLRGAAEGSSLKHWLEGQVWPLESRFLDAQYVRDGAELAIADLLTSGTTCFADMHLYPEVVAETVVAAKIRASIGLPILDNASVWASSTNEYFDKGLQLHDEYRNNPLVSTTFAPYAPWAVSDETFMRVQRAADELELPVTMHVNETAAEAALPRERTLARLERLGLLSPLLTAVHMVHLDASDRERAGRAGIHVAHCPQSNLKLGNGVCGVAALLEHGVNVAIGTDGAASNNDLSMLDELRTAALLARGLFPEATPIDAHDWLRMATLSGARALGLSDTIGSLAPGKWADVCCIDLARVHTQPVHDVPSQLLYAASRDQVSDVWVAGRRLVADGALTHMDVADLTRRANEWRDRIGGFAS
jgi:5-methylthioadenosine/S-adenosylhomocysteine deaminase